MTQSRVMLTGAGGAAAVSFIKATRDDDVALFAADMDAFAAGLYLVPAERRFLIPAGADPAFVPTVLDLCTRLGIDVLVPTVDAELIPLAQARERFEAAGVKLLLASLHTLETCLDKARLLRTCADAVPVGRFAVFDETFPAADWGFPFIVKPRSGSGSRGIVLAEREADLAAVPRDGSHLVQQYLPGEEYSVDVLAAGDGRLVAAVPRQRMKVDSGVAVTARTLHDPELEGFALQVAERIGLAYAANIQFRRDDRGTPALLEVNPRFPGTMPLTVHSGVNMPLLALRDALGEPPPAGPLPFDDVAVVRYWTEEFLDPSEIERVGAAAVDGA